MKYLILGASAAGINAAKAIRSIDSEGEITIISEDKNVYSRCMLHLLIADYRIPEGISFVENNFFEKYKITWIKGKSVSNIYANEKAVTTDDGDKYLYDKLLIATGANYVIPPIKNLREANGVFGLRNITDAIKIKDSVKNAKAVAVIGAGLVGVDAVIGLLGKGIKIYLIEMDNRILPLQLDKTAAAKYEAAFRSHGVDILTGNSVTEAVIDKDNNIKGLNLKDGSSIECDVVITAAGVRPNINFIDTNEIKVDKGIDINSNCETSQRDIYAAGDVTGIAPVWPIAVKQGIIAGTNMAGVEKLIDDKYGARNSMNFLGINTVSVGIVNPPDSSYEVNIYYDGENYKKIIHKNGIIYGAIVQGDISYSGHLLHMIKNKVNIASIKKSIFNIDYSDFYDIKDNGEYKYKVV